MVSVIVFKFSGSKSGQASAPLWLWKKKKKEFSDRTKQLIQPDRKPPAQLRCGAERCLQIQIKTDFWYFQILRFKVTLVFCADFLLSYVIGFFSQHCDWLVPTPAPQKKASHALC